MQNNKKQGHIMKDEIHSTSINPDVVEQFLALMNTHCKSSEEALTMLSTLCYNLMMTCGINSMDSQMLNGHGISIQLQGIDIAE
ncbi:hypothetical protein E8211_005074, partial [Escherichia coli]|nr:hypothetical protein [Escherichia coli]